MSDADPFSTGYVELPEDIVKVEASSVFVKKDDVRGQAAAAVTN